MEVTVDVIRFLTTTQRQAQAYFGNKRDVIVEVNMPSVIVAAGLDSTDIAYGRR